MFLVIAVKSDLEHYAVSLYMCSLEYMKDITGTNQ